MEEAQQSIERVQNNFSGSFLYMFLLGCDCIIILKFSTLLNEQSFNRINIDERHKHANSSIRLLTGTNQYQKGVNTLFIAI